MNRVRMIVTDLDDTLLRTDQSISEYSLSVFARCKKAGIVTAVATGRLEIEAQRFVDILHPDIVISNDGALARYNGQIIFKSELDADTVNRLIAELLGQKEFADIIVSTEDVCYWNSTNISDNPDRPGAQYNDYSTPFARNAIKVVAEIPRSSEAASIMDKFPECRIIPYWRINRYSFLSKGTSKMNAIKITADLLGISLSEVAAFGDDYNDIEMIEECGVGIAVANAIEQVLMSANHTTKSNEQDGVAVFIEEHFLQDSAGFAARPMGSPLPGCLDEPADD